MRTNIHGGNLNKLNEGYEGQKHRLDAIDMRAKDRKGTWMEDIPFQTGRQRDRETDSDISALRETERQRDR